MVEVDEDYEEDEDDEEVSVNQLFKEAIRSHSADKEWSSVNQLIVICVNHLGSVYIFIELISWSLWLMK